MFTEGVDFMQNVKPIEMGTALVQNTVNVASDFGERITHQYWTGSKKE
jgi:hypothetical protein